MSIKRDEGLIEKYREIQDATSMTVKILQSQVIEVVVADLMAKYKAAKMRREHDNAAAIEKVVKLYFLTEEEFDEFSSI